MDNSSIEFNTQLELDVLLNGLTDVTQDYVNHFDFNRFTDVIIPEGVPRIGEKTFQCCKRLTHVKIGNGLKSIGGKAFEYCRRLKSITIPDSVTRIGYEAFRGCEGLTSVTIPNSVESIELWAFYSCKRLTNMLFEGKTLDEVKAMRYYPWGIFPEYISVQVP